VSELTGRTVLVTGACSGVGRGIALALGAAGANVVATCRDGASDVTADLLRRGGSGLAARCDVTNRADVAGAVAAAVDRFGGLDAVIHNATSELSSQPADLATADPTAFASHLAVAVDGARWCALEAYPHLRARQGTLVVLTSPAGIEGNGTLPFYAAAKGAQRGLVKSLAREWGASGVTVNCLAPLAMTPAMERAFETNPGYADRVLGRTPLGRLGDPELDIGPAAVFLVSPGARYLTGQTLAVNGGSFMSL
jgi:3-oxoacyl-[acyl-carrier protein] reductase